MDDGIFPVMRNANEPWLLRYISLVIQPYFAKNHIFIVTLTVNCRKTTVTLKYFWNFTK